MRSSLMFKLALRKPSLLVKDKSSLGFTFLQSQHFDKVLKLHHDKQYTESVKQFLNTPFTIQDLKKSSLLQERYTEHIQSTQSLYFNLKKNKDKIGQNIKGLAQRNILDVEIWKKIFAEVLEFRFHQLQDHPDIEQIFIHLEAFFHKFEEDFKFHLDKSQLLGLLTLRQKSTQIFSKSKKIGSIRLQTAMINFFMKASTKVEIEIRKMREYYQQNLINKLQQILQAQKDIADLARFQLALDSLHLAKRRTRQIITDRINQIMSNDQSIKTLDSKAYQAITTNWANMGIMRDGYDKIFQDNFNQLIDKSPVLLLRGIVACRKQTPQLIDRIIENLKVIPYDQLQQKSEIHQMIHILMIRNYDLKKHEDFINKLSQVGCQKLHHKIANGIRVQIESNCMKQSHVSIPPFVQLNASQRLIISYMKDAIGSNYSIFSNTKICRFDVLFGAIIKDNIYVFQFRNLKKAINQPKIPRALMKLKKQLFEYYGIHQLLVNLTYNHVLSVIKKRQKFRLTKEIQTLIQNI